MKKTYYSNGKLLITAEYLVLDGATALALPTKFGQNLVVENGNNNQICWKSFDVDETLWFNDIITFEEIKNKTLTAQQPIKNTLIEILHQALQQNKNFINDSNGYNITTHLSFPRNWGLGTSSTLINNIAQWLEIDAFDLLNKSFGGSGYDVACAQNNCSILYHLENKIPNVEKIRFCPQFNENIYFVYLNKKQNSRQAIENYRKKNITNINLNKVDGITNEILVATNVQSFALAIKKHEELLSQILETETIHKQLFIDFTGTIKSLGAWGGDFVMVISDKNPENYFRSKGYNIILKYSEMIL